MNEILPFLKGSGCRTTFGSSYLKTYSTNTYNVTVTHYESAKLNIQNVKGKH